MGYFLIVIGSDTNFFPENRAYIIGASSRGDDCGGNNHPGVYTDMTKPTVLKWIGKHTRRGRC